MAVLSPADANNRSIRTQPSDVTDDVNDHLIATNFLVDIQTQNIWTHFHLIKFQFNFKGIKKKNVGHVMTLQRDKTVLEGGD